MADMKNIKVEKVVLNICTGKDQKNLEKGIKLLKMITGLDPIKTLAKKRIAQWGLRPGLPIGCKITLRNEEAGDIIKRLLDAKEFKLRTSQFDDHGNISFGLHEYIDIPGVQYDPDIGVMGLQICITLERPGFRIKRRRLSSKLGKDHKITQNEAIDFIVKGFNVKIGDEENDSQ